MALVPCEKGHKRSMAVAINKTTKEIVNAYHDNEFELEEGADSAKDDSLVKMMWSGRKRGVKWCNFYYNAVEVMP